MPRSLLEFPRPQPAGAETDSSPALAVAPAADLAAVEVDAGEPALALTTVGRPMTVKIFAAFFHIPERAIWRLIDEQRIRTFRMGKKLLIPHSEIERIAETGVN